MLNTCMYSYISRGHRFICTLTKAAASLVLMYHTHIRLKYYVNIEMLNVAAIFTKVY